MKSRQPVFYVRRATIRMKATREAGTELMSQPAGPPNPDTQLILGRRWRIAIRRSRLGL
jgi:hypothetical protein